MAASAKDAQAGGTVAGCAFELRDIVYAYDDIIALNGLSLRVPAGQRMVLLGANGCGKTTLLRILDGLYFPGAGTIAAFGRPLTEANFGDRDFVYAFRRRVGLVFQNSEVQLFNPTVFDELAFGPLQLGWDAERIRAEVDAMLAFMGLTHLQDRAPHRLSGGEQKRVALASVLITDPEVLLLDEPTAGLDPESVSQLIDLLIDWGDGAKTVITATHDLDIVEDIADTCVVLAKGKRIAEGRPDDIVRDEALLGRSRLIHAHRHSHTAGETHRHHHLHRHGDGHGA